ncbi:hypothetical protein SARC_04104 [Sphaeroforma arctica JP610]|uniref:Mitoferrin-1 n=1 Tax=Sphaeroforma arctica JP610 TaxID=667725 RepID=A0A0L0G604_9EUKA|nr:hypothetical protein SARC_04104 [Sphaeroforma arctica JP610]KNC83643.1 hypothetical protein SARC_04104 [Sphaeroforma arctica JP610]|eukprot:XP_014157545.1 hypothetical protein SARC_04104 [Sphaeroforma arctica JP610]
MEPGEEYEYLPTSNLHIHMAAGAMAGVMEHCTVYPIDSIKTKMQSLNPTAKGLYNSFGGAIRSIRNSKGLLSTFKGVNAVALGAGPAHAIYFGSYEMVKTTISNYTGKPDTNPMVGVPAGLAATFLHDSFMTPFEMIKQRLQMHSSPYTSASHVFREVWKQEGPRAFYRSLPTQLSMNVPFQVIHFSAYENIRHLINPDDTYNPLSHVVAGGSAGAMAAAVTTPLDVLKTTLNTQESRFEHQGRATQGMWNAARDVYALHGYKGFLRGVQARMLFHIPSTAICWSVYEFFKHTMKTFNLEDLEMLITPDQSESMQSESMTSVGSVVASEMHAKSEAPSGWA